MTGTYSIPLSLFDELARGGGGRTAVEALRRGQISKRLVQLRALLDGVDDNHSADSRVTLAGWELLSALDRQAAADLLQAPQVGAWLARSLEELYGQRESTAGRRPSVVQLAAIAAAAAVRSRQGAQLAVPVRDGVTVLPTVGLARFADRGDGFADLRYVDGLLSLDSAFGSVRVRPDEPGSAASGWLPMRHLSAVTDEARLSVQLDDLDLFRSLPGLRLTGRLDADEARGWARGLRAAWRLLVRHHAPMADELAAGLSSIVPLDGAAGSGVSATSVDSFGAAAMSRPASADAFALAMVHEFQHSKLSALLDIVPLYDPELPMLLYAPWRDDPRPLSGLLQGTYAFTAVATFWGVQRQQADGASGEFADFEFTRWRDQAARAADVIASSAALTPEGERFVSLMSDSLAALRAEPVPARVSDAAREAAADHWLTWRARNLRPPRDRVRTAEEAWRRGRRFPVPPAPTRPVEAGTFAPTVNGRLVLLQARLRDHGDQDRTADSAATAHATTADIAYAAGDYVAAAERYARTLTAEPDSAHAWAGLVLAQLRGGANVPTDLPIEYLPALSAELARSGAAAAPEDLAAWLAAT
jgi:HEXXH motif-containing protein